MYEVFFNREFTYDVNGSVEDVLKKLQENTAYDNKCDSINFINKYDNTKLFAGIFNDNTFQIKAIVDSFSVKRGLFNPIIYGTAEEIDGITKLHIKMKCRKFYVVFGIRFVIFWFFAAIFVGFASQDLLNLLIYMLAIPFISGFFYFFIFLNFRDAKERIEKVTSDTDKDQ